MSLSLQSIIPHRNLCIARSTRYVPTTAIHPRTLPYPPRAERFRRLLHHAHRQAAKVTTFETASIQAKQKGSSATRPSQTYKDPSAAYASVLAASPTETLLYRSTSSTAFQQTCYFTGSFSIFYGCYHIYDVVFTSHPGLATVVPFLYGPVCTMCIAAGVYILYACRRLIGSISAVPTASTGAAKSLMLRVQGRTFFPWSTPKELNVPPHALYLPLSVEQVRNPNPEAFRNAKTAAGRRALEMEQDSQGSREGKGFRNIFKNLIGSTLSNFRKVLTREGLASVWIRTGNGQETKWRMDISTGWLLNQGFPIEKLARKYRSG